MAYVVTKVLPLTESGSLIVLMCALLVVQSSVLLCIWLLSIGELCVPDKLAKAT